MTYAKGFLAAVASIFGVLFVPTLLRFFWGISTEKATGLAVVTSGFTEALRSPLFWIEVLCIFALLLFTSRLGNKSLRAIFFWVPATVITMLGCAVIALLTFIFFRFRP